MSHLSSCNVVVPAECPSLNCQCPECCMRRAEWLSESCRKDCDEQPTLERPIGRLTGRNFARIEIIGRCVDTFEHGSTCSSKKCQTNGCYKMKKMIAHSGRCDERKHCKSCKMYLALCCYHAKRCQTDNCQVVNCLRFRKITTNQTASAFISGHHRKRKTDLHEDDVEGENNDDDNDDNDDLRTGNNPKRARHAVKLSFSIETILKLDEEPSDELSDS